MALVISTSLTEASGKKAPHIEDAWLLENRDMLTSEMAQHRFGLRCTAACIFLIYSSVIIVGVAHSGM
jgi:hypothetical protein